MAILTFSHLRCEKVKSLGVLPSIVINCHASEVRDSSILREARARAPRPNRSYGCTAGQPYERPEFFTWDGIAGSRRSTSPCGMRLIGRDGGPVRSPLTNLTPQEMGEPAMLIKGRN